MAQQTINIGASPNDGTGTPLRTAFQYTNSNFSELYTAVGPSGNNIVVPGNATITGDLTVDTSTLKVDSTNNRVTVGTLGAYGRLTVGVGSGLQAGTTTNVASSLFDIDYASTGNINTRLSFVNSNGVTNAAIDRIGNPNFSDNGNLAFLTRVGAGSLTERYRIAADGVATWSEVGGVAGTAMTLNATGLGVGGSVTNKLTVTVTPPTSNSDGLVINGPSSRQIIAGITGATYSYAGVGANQNLIYGGNAQLNILGDNQNVRIGTSAGSYLLLNTSGNVGIGVTPSAWYTSYGTKALQFAASGALFGLDVDSSDRRVGLLNNDYINAGGNDTYINTGHATKYQQGSGVHAWLTAPSGTAGNAITFTQAMTLDASGNLLVGTTGASSLIGGSGAITAKGLAGTLSVNVTALATDYTLPIGAFSGIITIRSNGGGGSAVFMLDPNVGAVSIANNIVGRTITLAFSGGSWKLQQTAGTVPSTYNYLVLSTQ